MNVRRLAVPAALAAFFMLAVTAGGADTFTVRLVSQTSSTITLGWDPQPGYGYLFSADGVLQSRTNDATRTTVKFSRSFSAYEVAVITKGAIGGYPVAPPPTACADTLDNDGDGKVDLADPGCSSASDTDETDPAPPPTGAVFVSTAGNDSTCARGNPSQPCLTLNRAYALADNGDTVTVAAGSYGAQYIQRDEKYTTADTPDVVIQPAAGAMVTVADLQIGKWGNVCGTGFQDGNAPSNLTVRNIGDNQSAAGVNCSQNGGATNDCEVVVGTLAYWITLENLDFCNVQMVNAHQVKVLGGDWGPCTAPTGGCSNMKMVDNTTNVLWDGAYIHDIRIVPGSGAHLECMFLGPGSASFITIQNSRFVNCEFYDIFVQPAGPNGVHDVTIQNNWFDTPFSGSGSRGLWAIGMSARSQPFSNFLIRFNSFHETSVVDFNNDGDNQTHQNVRFVGNVAHITTCYPSVSYSYNTMIGAGARTCGTGDAVSANVYANAGFLGFGGDFHLASGTTAEGRVTGTGADQSIGSDIDGQPRSAPRDSGSDER